MRQAAGLFTSMRGRPDPTERMIREVADPSQVRRRLAMGADPNQPGEAGLSAVQTLLLRRSPTTCQVLELLLEHGVDLAQRTPDRNYTPLLQAASSGDASAVRLLLARGAEVNLSGQGGVTPLMLAALRLDPELCELLIASGADVNARDERGASVLDYAQHEALGWHEQGEPLWTREDWQRRYPEVEAVLRKAEASG